MNHHGRGATINPPGRFEKLEIAIDEEFEEPNPRTQYLRDSSQSLITTNDSPDIGFRTSINPYRGCEHGCIYCYARPTHAWLGLSPGLDFESRIFTKPDAARLLAREIAAPGYRPDTIALGTATDPYQPVEREHRLTRAVLEVLREARHPVSITTKSDLVLRDLDLLAEMAAENLVLAAISLPTLDPDLARRLDPRGPPAGQRAGRVRGPSGAGRAPVVEHPPPHPSRGPQAFPPDPPLPPPAPPPNPWGAALHEQGPPRRTQGPPRRRHRRQTP